MVDATAGHYALAKWCYSALMRARDTGRLDAVVAELTAASEARTPSADGASASPVPPPSGASSASSSSSSVPSVSSASVTPYKYPIRHALEHLRIALDRMMGPPERVAEVAEWWRAVREDPRLSTALRVVQIQSEGMNSFYHGEIGRADAEARLRNPTTGAYDPGRFLVRFSRNTNTLCVSLVDVSGRLLHNLIFQVLGSARITIVDPRVFATMDPAAQHANSYPDLAHFIAAFQQRGVFRDFVRNPSAAPA